MLTRKLPQNTLIWKYAKEGLLHKALSLFNELQKSGKNPDEFIVSQILPCCAKLRALKQGKMIHAYAQKTGFQSDVYVITSLLDMYAKCSEIEYARQLFDEMPCENTVAYNSTIKGYINFGSLETAMEIFRKMGVSKSVITWNSMISGYADSGFIDEATLLLEKMKASGVNPDVFTWNSIISGYAKNGKMQDSLRILKCMQVQGVRADSAIMVCALSICAKLRDLRHGMELHCHALKCFGFLDVNLENSVLEMYVRVGNKRDACLQFRRMTFKDVFSWTCMITDCFHEGIFREGIGYFYEMQKQGIMPNVVTWNSMIFGYSDKGYFDRAIEVFEEMWKQGIDPDVVSWNSLITGCVKHGEFDKALCYLEQMQVCRLVRPNVVTWNAIVAGYVQNGKPDYALRFFAHMLSKGIELNPVILLSVVSACAHVTDLSKGREVHSFIVRDHCLSSDMFLGNALIDMYSKCGSVEDAVLVFEKMCERNVVTWNAMISAHGLHGDGIGALLVFERMMDTGQKPNNVTFIAILSACNHAGMVDEGREYFYRMFSDFKVVPCVEHYACMVDLLGRTGLIEEAHVLVQNMPFEPNASILGSLLNACKVQCNIELAEIVAQKLFFMEPDNPGNYVILANMYLAANRWSKVARMK